MRTQTIRSILLTLATSLALVAAPKLAPDLDGLKPGAKVDVIIKFGNRAMEIEKSNVTKAGGQ